MLYVKEAKGSFEDVCKKLEAVIPAHKFGLLGVYDLKKKLIEKGVEFSPQCRIFEVCNPTQAKKVLEAHMSISTALPCRISVYEEAGKVKIATLKPTAILDLFESPEIKDVAREVETILCRIIDEACI